MASGDFSRFLTMDAGLCDRAAELDMKKYGAIVSRNGRQGLLLPDLEGVDAVERQIDIARQKGGTGSRETYTVERFQVARHT